MATTSSPVRFASLLMLGAVLGKAFGFAREVLFARQLGATAAADSFRGAMTGIQMPLTPLQGDLVSSTLVPLFVEWREQGRSSRMTSSLGLVFTALATVLAVLIAVLATSYVDLLLGGFSPASKTMTASFARVMTPAMPASVIITYLGCIEVALGRSRMMSIRASVQNVSVLAGIIVMAWSGAVVAIAWAYSGGTILVAVYGLVMLWREGEISPRDVGMRSSIAASLTFVHRVKPLLVQPFADQGSMLLERLLASTLAIGTLASLDYARTITETVYYALGQPVGYVVLSQAKVADLRDRVRVICQPILSLSMPASVFVFTFAADITSLVFGRGAFQAEAIEMTSRAMQGIGVGLWATTTGWILVRMLNAQRRNGTVARVVACAYVANMVVDLASFRSVGPFGLGLGEAARGIVLVIGTAKALGCGGLLARLIMRTAPVTLLLGAAGVAIRLECGSHTVRLLAGASLYGVVLAAWLFRTEPAVAARGRRILGRWTGLQLPSALALLRGMSGGAVRGKTP